MQVRAALRRCAGEHEPSNPQRAQQDELLSDMAAEREPEEVDPLQAECIDEGDRIAGHLGDVLRNDACRAAHPAVVDEDDLAVARQAIDEERVPAVEVAAEVLQHHERQRIRLGIAEAPIGERDVACLNRKVFGRELAIGVPGGLNGRGHGMPFLWFEPVARDPSLTSKLTSGRNVSDLSWKSKLAVYRR